MSDIAARVSLHQDLTTNSVIEALKKRQARSPAIQPGEVSPSLAPYRAAAAVLHVFDPARLKPLGGGPASERDERKKRHNQAHLKLPLASGWGMAKQGPPSKAGLSLYRTEDPIS